MFVKDNRNILLSDLLRVSACRGSHEKYLKHKRNNPLHDQLAISEKKTVSITAIAPGIDIFNRNQNITSE